MLFEDIRHAQAGEPLPVVEPTALNAVAVTVAQLVTAREALAGLARDLRWDNAARQDVLARHYTETHVAAIDARLCALRKWEDLNDPDRSIAQDHLMEAATIATLVETDHGIGFDDARFGELVEFIAELPW
jgi:hypothetical protein